MCEKRSNVYQRGFTIPFTYSCENSDPPATPHEWVIAMKTARRHAKYSLVNSAIFVVSTPTTLTGLIPVYIIEIPWSFIEIL